MARCGRSLLTGLLVVTLGVLPVGPARAGTPGDAVNDAVGYAADRAVTSFISVVDRGTGAVLAQTGNAQTQVASESIMKLLLASYYLVLYGGYQLTPDSVKDQLSYMLRFSDDATASALFSANAIPTIAGRYGMGNTSNATDRVGHWGAARITAADMTTFLWRASKDPAVGPWLLPVMAQTAPNGSDGFDQSFGLNSLTGDHGSKQGWGCDSFFTDPTCAVHSVGYTDRTFVAVLQLSRGYPDPMRDTATHAAHVIQLSTKPDPIGSVDAVSNPAANTLRVWGWAADPAAAGQQEEVHVYVYGPYGRGRFPGIFTGDSRLDVAGVFPWAGPSSGFTADVQPQGPGTNTVCAYAINVNPPYTNPLVGCRSIEVRNPFGYYDSVVSRPGDMLVTGWALNPNTPSEQVEIRLYDSGPAGTREFTGFRAGAARPDVAAAFPGYGANHGFSAVIPSTEAGTHTVCAWAITTGGGSGNPLLGCRDVVVRNAFGNYDSVTSSSGKIVATGWAANPNNPGEHVQIYIYDTSSSGTRLYTQTRAAVNRPDVAAAFPGYGPDHGFATPFPAVGTGRHDVCTWAITTGGGTGNPWLGCRTVVVAG